LKNAITDVTYDKCKKRNDNGCSHIQSVSLLFISSLSIILQQSIALLETFEHFPRKQFLSISTQFHEYLLISQKFTHTTFNLSIFDRINQWFLVQNLIKRQEMGQTMIAAPRIIKNQNLHSDHEITIQFQNQEEPNYCNLYLITLISKEKDNYYSCKEICVFNKNTNRFEDITPCYSQEMIQFIQTKVLNNLNTNERIG